MTDEEILAKLPTPEEVIAAYERNNLRPRTEYADITDGMTCAIGACIGQTVQSPVEVFATSRGLDREVARDFGIGFDTGYSGGTYRSNRAAILRGVAVGQAVRKHFSEAQ